MDTLHVRSIPTDLYRRLRLLAKARNRSLSAQVVEILAEGVEEEELRLKQREVLTSIHRRRFIPAEGSPPSEELLKEERER